jgi:23S rRNA (adenine2503-C2)-methyltransferase
MAPRITELTRESAAELAATSGVPAYRAKQLLAWVFGRGVLDPSRWTDLPSNFKDAVGAAYATGDPTVTAVESDPGSTTEKFLLDVGGAETVEAVLIMEGDRSTVCLSTQVGCPVKCGFCASGLFGLKRNLTRGEILDQYLAIRNRAAALGRPVTNVVVMGMGEPMLNLGNLLPALATMNDPDGCGLGARHITVSTVGVAKGVERFTEEPRQYTLAFSLHAPDDALRGEIVPFPAAMSCAEIVDAAHRYLRAKGREVTFEYVLLDEVNCRPSHARALAELLRGVRGTVNVIPFNEVPEQPFRRPSDRVIDAFSDDLRARGLKVTVRKRKGHDIAAACGQLRLREKTKPAP